MSFLLDPPRGQKFGIVTGSTTVTQFPDVECQIVQFQAGESNTGTATYTDAEGSLTQGMSLSTGEFSIWVPTNNLNKIFYIMSSTLDTIKYHCVL